MAQAIKDAGDRFPTVWHKRNKREWLVILRAEDFISYFENPADWRAP
jgi:hypothetical protein